MAKKRHRPEEIVQRLRQVDVAVGQGMARLDAIREVRITGQTYYRWRKQYVGMGASQLKVTFRQDPGHCELESSTSEWTKEEEP